MSLPKNTCFNDLRSLPHKSKCSWKASTLMVCFVPITSIVASPHVGNSLNRDQLASCVAITPLASWSRFKEFPTWESEEHTSELQSRGHLVCRLLLEKKKR